jgi:hypothetical protein
MGIKNQGLLVVETVVRVARSGNRATAEDIGGNRHEKIRRVDYRVTAGAGGGRGVPELKAVGRVIGPTRGLIGDCFYLCYLYVYAINRKAGFVG